MNHGYPSFKGNNNYSNPYLDQFVVNKIYDENIRDLYEYEFPSKSQTHRPAANQQQQHERLPSNRNDPMRGSIYTNNRSMNMPLNNSYEARFTQKNQNYAKRRRAILQQSEENIRLMKRLMNVKPVISASKFEEDWKKTRNYLQLASNYPVEYKELELKQYGSKSTNNFQNVSTRKRLPSIKGFSAHESVVENGAPYNKSSNQYRSWSELSHSNRQVYQSTPSRYPDNDEEVLIYQEGRESPIVKPIKPSNSRRSTDNVHIIYNNLYDDENVFVLQSENNFDDMYTLEHGSTYVKTSKKKSYKSHTKPEATRHDEFDKNDPNHFVEVHTNEDKVETQPAGSVTSMKVNGSVDTKSGDSKDDKPAATSTTPGPTKKNVRFVHQNSQSTSQT